MEHITMALKLFRNMRARPRMFTIVREALLAEVTGILHVCVSPNNHNKLPELYAKYGPLRGNMVLNLNKEIEDHWAQDVLDEAIDCLEHENSSIEEAWRLISNPPMIAGPWVPCNGKCYRYNHLGHPLTCVSSAQEVVAEDHRLEALGYQLTDKGRVLPEHFFTCTPPEED